MTDEEQTSSTSVPAPADDGGGRHLAGMALPDIALPATSGVDVNLSRLGSIRTVVFAYPRTRIPGVPFPEAFEAIPGAIGCTPQALGFRDLAEDFAALGVRILGLSTNTAAYQREMIERLGIGYPVLSDEGLRLTRALRLPTFDVDGTTYLKRLTMIIRDGVIESVLYPVFPADQSAEATYQHVCEMIRREHAS
ncbi:MAG: peroxiredoxin [Hyphomicrobiaceae bacterium]|nr:peroxiredoxin [Hyphomicrobiaceae bacterium]